MSQLPIRLLGSSIRVHFKNIHGQNLLLVLSVEKHLTQLQDIALCFWELSY